MTKEEGLFYGDDLPERDPAGFEVLKECAECHGLKLRSRREFVNDVLWPIGYQARGMIVGFNLPFDLSRLAIGWGSARKHDRGGFSFILWDYLDQESGAWKENHYRPRLLVKHVDSKLSFIHFKGGRDIPKKAQTRGRFLDLRTFAFALTSKGHSLRSACEAFGVVEGKAEAEAHGQITPSYIDYNRQDVSATRSLFLALKSELEAYPIQLDPCKAYSPASISKSCLSVMGVKPPVEKFGSVPDEVHGWAMASYYGGRAEARIRRALVPVVTVDFLSMYPTVNGLMRLWDLITAGQLEVVDVTEEAQCLLESVDLESWFDLAMWRDFVFLAEVDPKDDILPVRARYDGQNTNIGINRFTSSDSLWYTGPDLVASKLLTGRSPKILRAIAIRPKGKQRDLLPIRLGSDVEIDPAREDFFLRIIELRKSIEQGGSEESRRTGQLLKILANSGAYGIFAEMNVQESTHGQQPITIHGLNTFEINPTRTEKPGLFTFPFLATITTGAARLMLAMLECCVTERGGSYAFCDTDSMAIVANAQGGEIDVEGERVQALSWREVDQIRERFAPLNPYDPKVLSTSSILEMEKENYSPNGERRQLHAWVISAKRYALIEKLGASFEIVKYSGHGLGHLLNPVVPESEDREWIRVLWEWIVSVELGIDCDEPPWLDLPALSRITTSSPALLRPFEELNSGTDYSDQIKPFNFMLSAHVAPFGHPAGADPTRFHLIAPYESDSSKWLDLPWIDRYSGERIPVTTRIGSTSTNSARLKTYRDVVELFRVHPEPKSAGPDGTMCGLKTRGLLRRRDVQLAWVEYVGKESHRLEEVNAGLIHDRHDVETDYGSDSWERIRLRLHDYTARELAEVAGISGRYVKAIRSGRAEPSYDVKRGLTEFLYRQCRQG